MTMQRDPVIGYIAAAACALALVVVVLGAYVRLADAGLGCPDWPGCYGHVDVPTTEAEISRANAAYSERPVERAKAWKEMLHRYAAGTLGLLVLALAALAWRRRERGTPVRGPAILAALVLVQALLGMWTVTLLLKPLIVLAHLAGGLALTAGLAWVALGHIGPTRSPRAPRWLRRCVVVGLAVVCLQIALGGWTSTNYAALACPDLPTCQGQWWPEADFATGFTPWHGLGIDYEGGVLDGPARTAIHVSHRLGAVVTAVVLGALALACAWPGRCRVLRGAGGAIAGVLALQIGLGIATVAWLLPLPVATAHNGGAALLLLTLVATLRLITPDERYDR
jgi:cytochrome c oxidase assembly protein subunit 15